MNSGRPIVSIMKHGSPSKGRERLQESGPVGIGSRNEALGGVQWYGPWRQYCFFPEIDTVFNIGCLNDINHFIGQLASQRHTKGETNAINSNLSKSIGFTGDA